MSWQHRFHGWFSAYLKKNIAVHLSGRFCTLGELGPSIWKAHFKEQAVPPRRLWISSFLLFGVNQQNDGNSSHPTEESVLVLSWGK